MIYTISKKPLLWISILTLLIWFTFAKTNNTICTMEYAPVCAEVQVQCIKAPCPPIQQTFWNKCQMQANSLAKFLYTWECKSSKLDLTNCETYFDGCNNCFVSDWNATACTMMYCETPAEPKCIKYKTAKDCPMIHHPWPDYCSGWTLVGWGIDNKGCEVPPECITSGTVWMANPASVYCGKNWWTLEIKSDEKWEYWICNFNDWSSCEERAYFRWECKKISPVEKYLSWYIVKNFDKFPDFQSKITFLQNLKNKFTRTYRSLTTSIQNFIETLYFNDYEKKKFTLDVDWRLVSFSLHIPKLRKNKYSEHTTLEKKSSTLIFKYNQSDIDPNMIFSITVVTKSDRDMLVKQWLLNTTEIIESAGYVFYYSQALDMPYTWKYADEYWSMIWAIKDIIQTFKIIK